MKEGEHCWLGNDYVRVHSTWAQPSVVEGGGVQHGATVVRVSDGAIFHTRPDLLRETPAWLGPQVKVKLLRPSARAPEYKTAGAAGADVYADLSTFSVDQASDVVLLADGDLACGKWSPDGSCDNLRFQPGTTVKIPLGFALEIPPGWVGVLKGRSGLATAGHEGHLAYIDSDYRGECCMILHVGPSWVTVQHGDRIGQIAFIPVGRADLQVVDELGETERGVGGFGSTGAR